MNHPAAARVDRSCRTKHEPAADADRHDRQLLPTARRSLRAVGSPLYQPRTDRTNVVAALAACLLYALAGRSFLSPIS